jgi:threonine aldolase
LLWLENTHVGSGGTVLGLDAMERMIDAARRADAHVHLDGSRIFNAAAHLGTSAARLARDADTVSVSLNKGLAAPMGAILAGSRLLIEQATRVRQMFGGGWRPAHIPAAAALVALRTMVDRIADDHARARELADGLRGIPGLRVDPAQVQTNIVFVDPEPEFVSAAALVERLRDRGVLAMQLSRERIRLVLWHGIGEAQVRRAIDAFREAVDRA